MYLVDTNIWLEQALDQARSGEVRHFLDATPTNRLPITDFSFHSIGVIFNRLDHRADFLRFVRDVLISSSKERSTLSRFSPGTWNASSL